MIIKGQLQVHMVLSALFNDIMVLRLMDALTPYIPEMPCTMYFDPIKEEGICICHRVAVSADDKFIGEAVYEFAFFKNTIKPFIHITDKMGRVSHINTDVVLRIEKDRVNIIPITEARKDASPE